MLERIVEAVKRQEEIFKERMKIREKLFPVISEVIRPRLNVRQAREKANASVVAVDSAYRFNNQDVLRRVDYAVVGVASWVSSYAVRGFYAPHGVALSYWEDEVEEDALLKALGAVAEIELLSDYSGQFRWALLDGSLFSTLIRLKSGLVVALRKGSGGLYQKVRDEIKKCSELLLESLSHGNLMAVPKRSTGEEFKTHVMTFWREAENFNDFELADMCLRRGEYIDLSEFIQEERIDALLEGLKKLGFKINDELESRIKNFSLFYVKGVDEVVHRVEFFGSREDFPSQVVVFQSILGTSELALISEADRIAKQYLNRLFLDYSSVFGSLRGG